MQEFWQFLIMAGVDSLKSLSKKLAACSSPYEKNVILDELPEVRECLRTSPFLRTFLCGVSPECELVFKQLMAIGQGERVLVSDHSADSLRQLLMHLLAIDHFYRELGGILGYQAKILELLKGEQTSEAPAFYHSPSFIDIAEETEEVQGAVSSGIETLPQMVEIYPLGGAADRLHLLDEQTGMELPAARLKFAGTTLLSGLIRDLQAREYLYYKSFGRQVTTPIAIMTSHEKDNHRHVVQICEDSKWFNRPAESFRFFTQPLVPAVNEKGDWHLLGPSKLLLKPGGHGALWKLARDEGVFDWFRAQGKTKALIRQINNPLAGLDYGLLAFTGIGCKENRIFGFASCPRLLQAAEGMIVLIERNDQTVLTNIEYCDFAKCNIEDRPLKEGEPYSRFSSNTNILFADLAAVAQAVEKCPYPGLLINLKKGHFTTLAGERKEEVVARLESTMQNIADVFVENKSAQSKQTFVTYNKRHKTISTAKKVFTPGKPSQETPEHCFYDLLGANRELLEVCGFSLPPRSSFEDFMKHGPDCQFLYHPALGPLYSLIRKKIQRGKLALGSELLLEIAEATLENFELSGSVQMIAEQVMGHVDKEGILRYSDQVGTCVLRNVTVVNRGVDWEPSRPFWKADPKRHESLKIILKGMSSFHAENVHFSGAHTFVVEDGAALRVSQKGDHLIFEKKDQH